MTERSWQSYRAEYASLTRSREPGDPEMEEARRNLKAAKLADYLRKQIAEEPTLTEKQVRRLSAILRGK